MPWFETITVFTVSTQLFNFWAYSQGRLWLSYWLTIVVYTGYIIVEGWLALRDPEQLSVLLFVGLDIYAVVMGIRGLIRLYRKETQ